MAKERDDSKDLSPSAVKRAVVNTVFQRPLILYSAVAACLGGVYALAIEASFLAIIAASAGGIISLLSWIWEFVIRGDKHAIRYVQRYRQSLEQKRHEVLQGLSKELKELGLKDALKQLELFKNKYQSFVEVLDKKFDPSELTYMRYLAVAEQVFLGGIDNLERVALAIDSVSAIDVQHIAQRLQELESDDDPVNRAKMSELTQRKQLWQDQHSLAKNILLENEKALTQLDVVATRIASIDTDNKQSKVALDVAMAELQHLIQRSSEYSKPKQQSQADA